MIIAQSHVTLPAVSCDQRESPDLAHVVGITEGFPKHSIVGNVCRKMGQQIWGLCCTCDFAQ